MKKADPAASTGTFTLDYQSLGLDRYHRHEAEDAADGGSGAVNPNSPEALAGDVEGAMAATGKALPRGQQGRQLCAGAGRR